MLRGCLILALLVGCALLVAPFLVASLYVDQRGIPLPGRVYSKREDVTIRYSDWTRSSQVTIEYFPPDQTGVAFFDTQLDPAQYDTFRKGETVRLHYLLRRDIPTLPLSNLLRDVHALPSVRLADRQTFSGLKMLLRDKIVIIFAAAVGLALLLFLWRSVRLPGFWWALGIGGGIGVVALLWQYFPMPTPRPAVDLHRTSGRVRSLGQIDRLFQGSHQHGLNAAQPVDVVGIEFVPEGRTEPVVAVDLIDAGSVAGLKENSAVAIDYEGGSPRTAYIQSAARTFVRRNLVGIAGEIGLALLVLAGFFVGAQFLGRAFSRLVQRRK